MFTLRKMVMAWGRWSSDGERKKTACAGQAFSYTSCLMLPTKGGALYTMNDMNIQWYTKVFTDPPPGLNHITYTVFGKCSEVEVDWICSRNFFRNINQAVALIYMMSDTAPPKDASKLFLPGPIYRVDELWRWYTIRTSLLSYCCSWWYNFYCSQGPIPFELLWIPYSFVYINHHCWGQPNLKYLVLSLISRCSIINTY